MSDQDSQEDVESAPTPAKTPPAPDDNPAPRRSSGIGWLSLVLVIALAGASAWLVREAQHREEVLAQRLDSLESVARNDQSGLQQASDRWERQLRSSVSELEESLDDSTGALAQRLDARDDELEQLQGELSRFSATDRDSWLLAEAGHLVRLANQRLVMAQDPRASVALLNGADAVLLEIDDPALHEARAALAADMAALRAVPRVDTEGIYLRLSALVEQADDLVIFEMPEQAPREEPEAAEDWQDRLRQGYESALAKLSSYVIVRRRDVPMQALMDPQWEGLVRQNLRMLLEQAQVALLSGNQVLYEASLERAQHWVAQFQESDQAAAGAMSRELTDLGAMTIGVTLPDISRSLQAMDEATAQRQSVKDGD